jgi:hypothetical protein
MIVPLLLTVCLAQEPTYEKEIAEKNKVNAESKMQDQKTFLEQISAKTQEVLKYARVSKDNLHKKQEALRSDFEKNLKAEIDQVKKKDPRTNVDAIRKSANEKRREMIEQMNAEKKSLEAKLHDYRERFDEFVKLQKENFREKFKALSQKAESSTKELTGSPVEQEFRDIPPGPATPLKPQ